MLDVPEQSYDIRALDTKCLARFPVSVQFDANDRSAGKRAWRGGRQELDW
jgi:hypothetical protein